MLISFKITCYAAQMVSVMNAQNSALQVMIVLIRLLGIVLPCATLKIVISLIFQQIMEVGIEQINAPINAAGKL